MRILATGATGVVGRLAVPLMLAAGHRVTATGRSKERLRALAGWGAEIIELDLFDREAVRQSVRGHDAVVNLATHMPFRTSAARAFLPGAWRENDRIKKVSSALLVDAALESGVARFVQESFAPIYPDSGDKWITEEMPPQVARYNRTVLDAERSARRFTDNGLTGVVLRFALFYGADDDFTRNLIKLVAHGWLPLIGKRDGFVSLLNHEDAATAVVAALGVPAGIYNVVDDQPLTRRELGDALATMLGVPPPKVPGPWVAKLAGAMGDVMKRSLRISNAKLRANSGWAPAYSNARQGLRKAIASFEGLRHAA